MKHLCLLLILIYAVIGGAGCASSRSSTPALSVKFATTQVLDGYVVAVLDGDTIDIVQAGQKTRIRIRGIDAPEKTQAFGNGARHYLASMVLNRQVRVLSDETDRYGRTLGVVYIDGRDVGAQMIAAGFAWHFKRYEASQPLSERAAYAAAELKARTAETGLWSDPAPVAPWNFRKAKRR